MPFSIKSDYSLPSTMAPTDPVDHELFCRALNRFSDDYITYLSPPTGQQAFDLAIRMLATEGLNTRWAEPLLILFDEQRAARNAKAQR